MGNLFLIKDARIYSGEKKNLFNNWSNWTSTCKKINLDTELTPFTKINLKWFTVLNIKGKTIKLLENNIENLK